MSACGDQFTEIRDKRASSSLKVKYLIYLSLTKKIFGQILLSQVIYSSIKFSSGDEGGFTEQLPDSTIYPTESCPVRNSSSYTI